MPSARLSRSISKYSRPARRSSSIRRRTVDSCHPIAAASAAWLARPSLASSASSGSPPRAGGGVGGGGRGAAPPAMIGGFRRDYRIVPPDQHSHQLQLLG